MNSQTLSAASLPFYVEDIAPLSLLIVIIIFASRGKLEFLMCRVFFFFLLCETYCVRHLKFEYIFYNQRKEKLIGCNWGAD
jgi:hypothetical protein